MKRRKVWEIPPEPDESIFREFSTIPKPIVSTLFHRGIVDAEAARAFFQPGDRPPADPFLLSGMEAAVDRILRAIHSGDTVVVYGDYDTDGVTATAMLVDFLQSAGASVSTYIPNRFDEGYGLNHGALEALADRGTRLIVTVDCGARSVQEAAFAAEKKIDLIITDHHPPGAEEPPVCAFINPKRAGCPYPEKNLSGVGVAYRLVQAVAGRLTGKDRPSTDRYLDLVAIGTVADMVPLLGENRYLVQAGLLALNDPDGANLRPGVDQMMQAAGIARGALTAQGIGFTLGPRLNAAGRLDTADAAVDLLLARDSQQARSFARSLETQNRNRQSITRKTVRDARAIAAETPEWDPGSPPFFIMVAQEGFHPGIIGLAATRLMEEFYRPVAVVAVEKGQARGSIRSVPGFHITQALDSCRDLLDRYGGHAAAAGFSTRSDCLEELRKRLLDLADEALSRISLQPILSVDSEIRLADLTWDLHRWITRLEPCGQGNPAPVFFTRNLRIRKKRCVGKDSSHLKLSLSDGRSEIDAIAFGFGHLEPTLSDTVDVAFSLEENNYYGKRLQMRVMDIHESVGASNGAVSR
jgi:single-stranded-DNA-specific exonuclease